MIESSLEKELKIEIEELKQMLYQSQAQILQLQSEKLDVLFKESQDRLEKLKKDEDE